MLIVNIASELFLELGEPTATSIPSIAYFLRAQVGTINNLLFEDFYINNETLEILDSGGVEISAEAAAILKAMYRVYDYSTQIRSNMNALDIDSIIEVSDQGSSVRKANRNEISKTFASLKKMEQDSLEKLITSYRMRGAVPQQVVGDDIVEGNYGGNFINDLRITTVQ